VHKRRAKKREVTMSVNWASIPLDSAYWGGGREFEGLKAPGLKIIEGGIKGRESGWGGQGKGVEANEKSGGGGQKCQVAENCTPRGPIEFQGSQKGETRKEERKDRMNTVCSPGAESYIQGKGACSSEKGSKENEQLGGGDWRGS